MTCLAGRERSCESLVCGCGGSGLSFSLLEKSTGVMLSRKDSMSGPSLVAAACEAAVLSARLEAVGLIRPETGGLREGGVCGMTSLVALWIEEGGEVLMFKSGRRLEARRGVSVGYIAKQHGGVSEDPVARNCKGG